MKIDLPIHVGLFIQESMHGAEPEGRGEGAGFGFCANQPNSCTVKIDWN